MGEYLCASYFYTFQAHTKRDKFENATFFYLDGPSVHTKMEFLMTENRPF